MKAIIKKSITFAQPGASAAHHPRHDQPVADHGPPAGRQPRLLGIRHRLGLGRIPGLLPRVHHSVDRKSVGRERV